MPGVVVIAAHPGLEHSRVNRALLEAAGALAAADGSRLAVRDLYRLYPDYLIDVAAEQALLAPARLLVWLHPVHWYSMPPLMKLWPEIASLEPTLECEVPADAWPADAD